MSEQAGLTSIHTIFMREHNRIAEVLHRLNPHWNDEIIYQNSRKIFTATYQQIVYNEFLPRILGWDAVDKYDLRLSSAGYYKSSFSYNNYYKYNRIITISNHTYITGMMLLITIQIILRLFS